MTQMTVLQPGEPFPSLTVALPGGRTLRLPDALAVRPGSGRLRLSVPPSDMGSLRRGSPS